jgi:tetratricopeptide (TPR) repeat protein
LVFRIDGSKITIRLSGIIRMKFIKKFNFYFLIILILLVATNNHCFSVDLIKEKETNNIKQVYLGTSVVIKIPESPPDDINEQRKQAFNELQPYLSKNINKASVIWQEDVFSYGKIASIANIYINDYLDKKINKKKFIEFFNLELLEPTLVKNNIDKININSVSDELIRQSLCLREQANLYRTVGKYDSAIRIYNQVIDLNPNDAVALFWLAEIYQSIGHSELSEQYYRKVLEIDPKFYAADYALYKLQY